MSIRVHRPETDRLELSRGDFLIVKRYLTAGEHRDLLRAAMRPDATELDPLLFGFAMVQAYLLDWSFADADGRPLPIADQTPALVRATLNRLDAEAYMEVQRAIEQHQTATAAALADEKKTTTGSPAPEPILQSVG